MIYQRITNTGRLFAGSEPRGYGKSAHQISPFTIPNLPRRQDYIVKVEYPHQ
jgi:hypothetical protein